MNATAEGINGLVLGGPIMARDKVGEVLERYPQLLSTFVSFGFAPLTNPLLRKTVFRQFTIGAACRGGHVETDKLLTALNLGRARLEGRRLSLNLLASGAPAPDAEPAEGPCCPHGTGRLH